MAFDQAYSRHPNSRNREEAEPKKKLKKKRSIRFSSGSWLRLSSKSQFNDTSPALVQQPIMTAASDSNAMKETPHEEIECDDLNSMVSSYCGSSDMIAKKQSYHEEIECDGVNSTVSSSCGSSDVVVVPSTMVSDDTGVPRNPSSSEISDDTGVPRNPSSSEISDSSPLSLKETTNSEGGKLHDQSESSYDSSDNHNGKSSSKSMHLSRSSSKRAVRVLIKKNGSSTRRDHALTNSKMSDNANVERGTCSSIIKDSRFPEHVELETAGQAETEGTSFVKVCPYQHCSLNGHCHDPPVEKKPFLRRRRQPMEPPKIDTARSVSGSEPKLSAGIKKGSKGKKKHQMGSISDGRSGSDMVRDGQSVPDKNIDLKFHEAVKDSLALEAEETTKAPALSLGSEKPKPMSTWQLIHRHMVSYCAAEEDDKPGLGANESKQVEEAEMSTSNVVPDLSDSEIGDSNQEVEVGKLLAIKLVREAIEKILLPEVQDQLSESQSVTSDGVEGLELAEKNHQNVPDESCKDESTSKQVDVDGSITTKEMKKSGKKSPSNWSNLKKWVLLQRFVKELEKVRKINYRKPWKLQLEAKQSAEKVSLRHQGGDEKKRAEEWMLDYALQRVVSELAPTQRKKVALLVKAFETVVPPQEEGILQLSAKENVAIIQESRKLKAQNVTPKPDELESLQSDKPRNAASMAEGKIDVKETENVDDGSESSRRYEDVIVASERSFGFPAESCNIEEKSEAGKELTVKDDENFAANSIVETELWPNSEHYCGESAPSTDEIHKVGDKHLDHSTSELESESIPGSGVVRVLPPLVNKTNSGENVAADQPPLDKQNYLNMWHSVCQHVVSSVSTKLVLDGNEEDTEEETKLKVNQSSRRSHHEAEFSRSQVLKLVKEAVQEILSPDIQEEYSGTPSTSGEILPGQDEGSKQGMSGSGGLTQKNAEELDKSKEGSSQGDEKELTNDVITVQDSKSIESVVKRTNDPPKAKNWRKLKKLLLLKRSINAMEEARKLKFRTQQLLPLPSDREPEKVDLRPQMVDERRKAEQWMLDYAVQHMVTQLTPARKKRVAMLVEAFEAVIPLPDM